MDNTQAPQDSGYRRKNGMYFDCSRAVEELNMPRNPIEIAMAKAIDWFEKNENIKRG